MPPINRRDFLKGSSLVAAAVASGGALRAAEESKSARGSASDALRVAVVGVNGRGRDHVNGFLDKRANCVITTICDCDSDKDVIGRAMKAVEKAQGHAPAYQQDIRKLVEDKNIDVISIATPNHWHALAALWAMQNGKDVYVEKPVSHNISEGRRLVEAAEKYGRICQAGTQSRSSTGMQAAMAFLHDGKLGKIRLARGICYKLRPSIGKVKEDQPIPSTVDYDLWCGPAPLKPLHRKKLHYDWHWTWDYGNGDLGNQGIHEMDKARWGLGKATLPKSVVSVGGRFGYVDDGETANTQICVFDYGDSELIFEVRGWPSTSPFPGSKSPKGGLKPENFVGNIFYGSEGVLVAPSYTSAVAYSNDGSVIKEFSGGDNHYLNFVAAVRSRESKELNAPIIEGHLSSALCHLGNISYRLGAEQPTVRSREAFAADAQAAEAFGRMEEHLKLSHIETENYRVGRKLMIDAPNERFVGDKQADALLTRAYRKGFEVPAVL